MPELMCTYCGCLEDDAEVRDDGTVVCRCGVVPYGDVDAADVAEGLHMVPDDPFRWGPFDNPDEAET